MSNSKGANAPVYSLAALVAILVSAVVVVLSGKATDGVVLVALAASTVPSLIAAIAAERTARDIHNGVMTEKVREGTVEALHDLQLPAKVDALTEGAQSDRELLADD